MPAALDDDRRFARPIRQRALGDLEQPAVRPGLAPFDLLAELEAHIFEAALGPALVEDRLRPQQLDLPDPFLETHDAVAHHTVSQDQHRHQAVGTQPQQLDAANHRPVEPWPASDGGERAGDRELTRRDPQERVGLVARVA